MAFKYRKNQVGKVLSADMYQLYFNQDTQLLTLKDKALK